MNPLTLQALNESILKWQAIADGTNEEYPDAKNCPLCALFHMPDCDGCPVKAKTGKPDCEDTPYWDAADNHSRQTFRYNRTVYLHNAKKELEFLKSLLPQ